MIRTPHHRVPGRRRARMSDFILGLPKAELHVHHVGSASPRIVSELAARHPGTVPSDLDELRRFYEFRDFAHFIEVYLAVVALIRTPEDIHYLTYEIAREMATDQGLRYAELTLDYALDHRPEGLVAFGLGGPEAGVPRPQFQPHFERARAAGLHSVPH